MPEQKLFWYSYQVMITEGDGRGYRYMSRAVNRDLDPPITLSKLMQLERDREREILADFELADEVNISIINFRWIEDA